MATVMGSRAQRRISFPKNQWLISGFTLGHFSFLTETSITEDYLSSFQAISICTLCVSKTVLSSMFMLIFSLAPHFPLLSMKAAPNPHPHLTPGPATLHVIQYLLSYISTIGMAYIVSSHQPGTHSQDKR